MAYFTSCIFSTLKEEHWKSFMLKGSSLSVLKVVTKLKYFTMSRPIFEMVWLRQKGSGSGVSCCETSDWDTKHKDTMICFHCPQDGVEINTEIVCLRIYQDLSFEWAWSPVLSWEASCRKVCTINHWFGPTKNPVQLNIHFTNLTLTLSDWLKPSKFKLTEWVLIKFDWIMDKVWQNWQSLTE